MILFKFSLFRSTKFKTHNYDAFIPLYYWRHSKEGKRKVSNVSHNIWFIAVLLRCAAKISIKFDSLIINRNGAVHHNVYNEKI